MTKKIELGQFFTKKDLWIRPQIRQFIDSINFNKIVDPFAGAGHLLTPFTPTYQVAGYDIDPTLTWPINDGLKGIPNHKSDLCITNPPYLAKTTATRFKRNGTYQYFEEFPEFDNLYLMGLEQCLKSFDSGIAIIPETYLLHPKKTNRLISATILEENPFDDTDFPVVIVIWGASKQDDYDIYKNDVYLGTNKSLTALIPKSKKLNKNLIKFNDPAGNFGIICIDKGDTIGGIRFTTPNEIKGAVKVSSRTSTKLHINCSIDISALITECNSILQQYRKDTADVYMAPFKGNDQLGQRRRRLDFTTARLIIENALVNIGYVDIQTKLFDEISL
jgi:hypothetical protein